MYFFEVDQPTTAPVVTTASKPPLTLPTTIPDPSSTTYKVGVFTLDWKNKENSTYFQLSTQISGSGDTWAAFALSKDTKMGEDDVIVCISQNGNTDIQHLYNPNGHTAPVPIDSNNLKLGLSNINVRFENNRLICSFDRVKSLPGIEKHFNLNGNKYFILNAWGSVARNVRSLSYHKERFSSATSVDFETGEVPAAGKVNENLIKAHAILMVIAWLFITSTAIIFARYYKYLFGKKLLMDVQFWFFAHRGLMILVMLVSVVGLILVLFYKNGEWIEPKADARFIHSIFGIVSIGLGFANPIMAYFRPAKDSPKRPVFNWAHRLLGIFIYLIAGNI